jgi:Zinc-binding dehydrogenase/Alcohol dehydrogenase GroES-like domain
MVESENHAIAAKNDRSFARESVRRKATDPSDRVPWSWNTFFARSSPMMLTSSMDASLFVAIFDNHDLGTRCRRRGVHPIGVYSHHHADLTPSGKFRRIDDYEAKGEHPVTHAIRFHKTGGPEVLQWEDVQVGSPGRGEARVRNTAVGLNYVDTYFRSGHYPAPLPSGLGAEGAGVVEEVGPGVIDIKLGDRVAYGNGPQGAYSEARVMPADRLVVLPDGVSDQQGAAMMLKGMTTQYLIRQTHKVGKGDVILIHAAAGGVGLIACQWAKALGATVIGTVGSDEKAKFAKANGCDHPIVYTREDFVERV